MSHLTSSLSKNQDQPFFNRLTTSDRRYVVILGETIEFPAEILHKWELAGLVTEYIPFDAGEAENLRRLQQFGQDLGVGDTYAIVGRYPQSVISSMVNAQCIAFGDAASTVLQAYTKPQSIKLVAIIAYYPSAIPSPSTKYPSSVKIIVHFTGTVIGVKSHPQMLGMQSAKLRTVRRRISSSIGIAARTENGFQAYQHQECEPGFAEHDLEEFDEMAEKIAFSRSLAVLKEASHLDDDQDRIR